MITLKSLGRKLLKLEASMRKDAKRLSKLIRKIEKTATAEAKPTTRVVVAVKNQKDTPQAARPAKSKRKLTPEGRAKLVALMSARWAAKRAASVSSQRSSKANSE